MKTLMNNKGSSIIALPIAIILIMSLVVGFVLYSYTYYQKIVMDKAVREGARMYRTTERLDKAIEAVNEELKIGMVKDVTVSMKDNRITASKAGGFYIPIANKRVFQLKSSAIFRKEDELRFYWEDHYR